MADQWRSTLRAQMADQWRRLRPKHRYATAVLGVGVAVGVAVGVVVLVTLLCGRGVTAVKAMESCKTTPTWVNTGAEQAASGPGSCPGAEQAASGPGSGPGAEQAASGPGSGPGAEQAASGPGSGPGAEQAASGAGAEQASSGAGSGPASGPASGPGSGRAQPRSPKIVGGKPAELPFIVSFGTSKAHACHGSLVGSQYVVTTAYCITTNTAFLKVTAGRSDLDGEGGVTRSISDYRVHPKWDPNNRKSWAYDEAVVKLDRPVENIRPVCLAAAGSVFPTGTNATVYGWGRVGTSEDLPAPRTLQAVNVTVNDHGQCKRKYYGKVTDHMICAGNDKGGQNICQGDSGAPLVVKVGDDFILLGSNIRGPRDCSARDSPAVYLIQHDTFTTDAITEMSDPPQVTQCGMRNNVPDVRVENGQVSAPHSLPWMAYLERDGGYFRGGAALIHESFVVTEWARPGEYVVFGAHNRSSTSEPTQRIRIEQVFMHPNFTWSNWPYLGMRLAKLSHPVKFTKNIRPICLPKPGYVLPAGSKCLVSGWGDNEAPGGLTDLLREGSVTTITTDQCRREWADEFDDDYDNVDFINKYITNSTICTAADETHPSIEDWGGPLVCEEEDSLLYHLHGVYHFPGWWWLPSLYYDVSAMLSWINEILADAANIVCFKKFEG